MPEFFCPLPWIHQFVQPTGIKMCCTSGTSLPVTSQEFADSDYIKNVRSTIAAGSIPADCRSCVNQESQGFISTRTQAIKDWSYNISNVPENIEYLDLRYSNLCNFSCRTCEPLFSSSIAREQELHPKLNNYYKKNPEFIHSNILEDIKPHVPSLKKLNLTGGEPLLVKENIAILEYLLERGRQDIQILVTTNASVVNPKILKLLKRFNDVHWTVSIDGVGKVAEYIRNGTIWDTVNKNFEQILLLRQSVLVNVTVSAYSVLDLSNLCRWFKSHKDQRPGQPMEIMFQVVQYPIHLQPLSLPESLIDRAKKNLDESIDIIKTIENNPKEFLNTLQNLRIRIQSTLLSRKFIEFTKVLDQTRNQQFNYTFGINHET